MARAVSARAAMSERKSTPATTAAAPSGRAYRRLPPGDRRRQIVEAAVSYFAEHGFEGATRGLARRLGVTQPLIYRYFASKDDLIRAVYEHVYLSRWRGEWTDLLARAEVPLRERLTDFYARYCAVVFEPEWMRIYLHAGLRGLPINRWWITFVEEHVLARICEEVRREAGLPGPEAVPITPAEVDGYWLFHGGIFYYGVRRDVYGVAPRLDLDAFVAWSIDSFLSGYPATVRAALAGAS